MYFGRNWAETAFGFKQEIVKIKSNALLIACELKTYKKYTFCRFIGQDFGYLISIFQVKAKYNSIYIIRHVILGCDFIFF
jgi:hypothetical protein